MMRTGLVIGENRGREAGRRLAARRVAAAPRRRVWPRVLAAAGALAALAALAAWLLTAPLFAVSRVESGRYRFAPEREVAALLEDALGENLWSLPAGELCERLEELPWVASSRIRRRLPGTVVVEFREWAPLLNLAEPAGAPARTRLVLLESGELAELPPELPLPDLPFLGGARVARDEAGRWRLERPAAARLLELAEAIACSGLERRRAVDLVVAEGEELSLVLRGGPQRLLLGQENFRTRLDRYLVLEDKLETVVDVDLRFRDRVLCRGSRAEEKERS